ncbi:kinase-like domain-containing protein [Pilobolus umbonatus]|nr:kinase-like domain-containing protein [Pilobolus umbonatus]
MSFIHHIKSTLNKVVDSVVDIYDITNTSPDTLIRVSGHDYRIKKLLGEGGFSFVYLGVDDSNRLYAIKTIRSNLGKESVTKAIKEAIVTSRFEQCPYIIDIVDMCVIKEEDKSKTAYIIMPYYKNGNIQDIIDRHEKQGKFMPENMILSLFKGICYAVQAMHEYRNKPWAHRDIKPANVLISDEGTPVLMDFGSAREARIHIDSQKMAMRVQDDAAENCSMPYRAPELFHVSVDTVIDEKVDIWSLGCTLYAMAYHQSPFEMTVNKQGGTMALAVLNKQYSIPQSMKHIYSQSLLDMISWMLTVDPSHRPNISSIINKLQ